VNLLMWRVKRMFRLTRRLREKLGSGGPPPTSRFTSREARIKLARGGVGLPSPAPPEGGGSVPKKIPSEGSDQVRLSREAILALTSERRGGIKEKGKLAIPFSNLMLTREKEIATSSPICVFRGVPGGSH